MLKNKLLVAALAASFAMPAMAEGFTPSSNVSLVSNYLYRGISQTGGGAALQGGFDVAHESGFYAGMWGSNVSWLAGLGATSASLELDTYAGFKGAFAGDFSYDVGFLRYNYPGTYPDPISTGFAKADTNEIYGAIGWKWVTFKYSNSLGNTFGLDKSNGSNYAELNASYTLEDAGVTLGAHYGKQTYKGSVADGLKAGGADPTYSDYKLSASKDFSGYVVGLAYSSTNTKKGAGQYYAITQADGSTTDLGKNTVVLSLSRAM